MSESGNRPSPRQRVLEHLKRAVSSAAGAALITGCARRGHDEWREMPCCDPMPEPTVLRRADCPATVAERIRNAQATWGEVKGTATIEVRIELNPYRHFVDEQQNDVSIQFDVKAAPEIRGCSIVDGVAVYGQTISLSCVPDPDARELTVKLAVDCLGTYSVGVFVKIPDERTVGEPLPISTHIEAMK